MRYAPLLLFLTVCLIYTIALVPAKRQDAQAPATLPAFSLPALDGGTLTSATIKRPALVHFFASWCASCAAEYPLLNLLSRSHGVAVYGIAWKDSKQAVQKTIDDNALAFTRVGIDEDGKSIIALGVQGVPETFLIDRNGMVAYHSAGPLSQEAIDTHILPLFEQGKPAQ